MNRLMKAVRDHWELLAVAAVAVALRLPYLGTRSLWYDEASSWQTARFPPVEMIRSLRLNVHMPLYYVVLKGWMAAFGESVVALRSLSVALGALTAFVMGCFAREIHGISIAGVGGGAERIASDWDRRGLGVAVAGLVAVSPYQVLASIEARMYTLGTALAASSGWLLAKAVRGREPGWAWPAYGAVCAALLYTHHYGLFTVVAQLVFLGLYVLWLAASRAADEAKRVGGLVLAVAAVVGLLYLPGLEILSTQSSRVQRDYWIRPMTWQTPAETFNDFVIPEEDSVVDSPRVGWVLLAVFAVSCAVLALGARRGDALVLASATGPLVAAAAASSIVPIWVSRYFRLAHLFILTTIVLAVWRVFRPIPALRAALLGAAAAGLLAANVVFWNRLDIPNGQGVRGLIQRIQEGADGDRMIVALDYRQYFPLKYYARARDKVRLVRPAFDLFWGPHLIRPGDVIEPESLSGELGRGVWIVHTSTIPANIPALDGLKPEQTFSATSYNRLHRRVWASYFVAPAAGSSDRSRTARATP